MKVVLLLSPLVKEFDMAFKSFISTFALALVSLFLLQQQGAVVDACICQEIYYTMCGFYELYSVMVRAKVLERCEREAGTHGACKRR